MQRNGQNPVKSAKTFEPLGAAQSNRTPAQSKTGAIVAHCPACQAEVPPKPGFRPSSLKCPKCGAAMGKK